MEIILSSTSSVPIYQQITDRIKELIIKGELAANSPLPSMRKLAKDLHVSIITTQRAYEELEKDGFIVILPAKGAFVSSQNSDFIKEENLRRIDALFADACLLAKQNGISQQELVKTLTAIFEEI